MCLQAPWSARESRNLTQPLTQRPQRPGFTALSF